MALATTFRFDSATHSDRTASRLEFAAAFAVVVALHVALAVWVLRSREIPLPPPEPPRTIVAQLLSAPPPAPPRPTVAPTPPRPAPVRPVEPPRPAPRARVKAPVAPRPVHHATPVLAHETPTPAPTAAPAAPAPAAPPTPATPPAATTAPPAATAAPPAASAQPSAANAAPKEVSHVDCNIGQPAYPAMSQRHDETGTAVVHFVVGVDGHVESANIQHSSGYERLDDAALAAVRGGTCRPWKEAGVPVRVAYTQPFVFGLGN